MGLSTNCITNIRPNTNTLNADKREAALPLLNIQYKNDYLSKSKLIVTKDQVVVEDFETKGNKMVYFLVDAAVKGKKYKKGDVIYIGWGKKFQYKKGTKQQKSACYLMISELLTAHREGLNARKAKLELIIEHLIKENFLK